MPAPAEAGADTRPVGFGKLIRSGGGRTGDQFQSSGWVQAGLVVEATSNEPDGSQLLWAVSSELPKADLLAGNVLDVADERATSGLGSPTAIRSRSVAMNSRAGRPTSAATRATLLRRDDRHA
ncbi:hypothetical protein GCM10009557_01510 [Virgisporangium ochraceum]|uniref:Uncharacterized protein n=1 Tax=Virgisporangium ochraceum TaxID=65505 RepID=A0A8J4A7B7_9ACTN|nr:hypothetical protein Voc01_090980 [Virgisporangium ochraceum]